MAIINEKNVLNESWNNQPKADVRVALQAKLREMVKDISIANNSTPDGVDLSIKDNKLTVTVTLVNGAKKSSVISIEELTKDIVDSLKKKATLNAISGRLEYPVLPDMVLVSMGKDLDGKDIDSSQWSDVFYYDPDDGIIKYVSRTLPHTVHAAGVPSSGLTYCNAVTGKLYLWDAMQGKMQELYIDKADLVYGMLSVSQWPQVVLRKVDDSTPTENYNEGDMFYDSGCIWKVTGNASRNMGVPSKRLVYYHQDGKKFYRWDGGSFVEAIDIPTKVSQLSNDKHFLTEHQKLKTINNESIIGEGNITIEGGQGGSIAVDTVLDENSENAIANSTVTVSITELKRRLKFINEANLLNYGVIPPVLLDDMNYEFTASQDGTYDAALVGKTMLCTDGIIRHFYYQKNDIRSEVHVTENPANEGLAYWSKKDGKTYRWDRASRKMYTIGFDPDLKTDIDQLTQRLPWALAPKVVFDSMGRELDNHDNTVTGNTSVIMTYIPRKDDVVFNPETGLIRYYTTAFMYEEYQPEKGLIYCNKNTDTLYRWTGSTMKAIGDKGSGGGGGSYNASVVEVTEISGGTYNEAVTKANSQPDIMFQWILSDTDPITGYQFRKVIWHVGKGEFIDANGDIIEL